MSKPRGVCYCGIKLRRNLCTGGAASGMRGGLSLPRMWSMIVGVPESFELELETDGNEALKRYRERGPYDLVLSDLRLPGLSGPDLARAIRSKNPAQRIV